MKSCISNPVAAVQATSTPLVRRVVANILAFTNGGQASIVAPAAMIRRVFRINGALIDEGEIPGTEAAGSPKSLGSG